MRLIDADAFDKALSDAQAECKRNGGNFRFGVLANVRGNLSKVPSVDAVPVKHGRWTTKRTQKHDGEWYCTVCDYEPIVMSDDMKYCPGCGAMMDMEG